VPTHHPGMTGFAPELKIIALYLTLMVILSDISGGLNG